MPKFVELYKRVSPYLINKQVIYSCIATGLCCFIGLVITLKEDKRLKTNPEISESYNDSSNLMLSMLSVMVGFYTLYYTATIFKTDAISFIHKVEEGIKHLEKSNKTLLDRLKIEEDITATRGAALALARDASFLPPEINAKILTFYTDKTQLTTLEVIEKGSATLALEAQHFLSGVSDQHPTAKTKVDQVAMIKSYLKQTFFDPTCSALSRSVIRSTCGSYFMALAAEDLKVMMLPFIQDVIENLRERVGSLNTPTIQEVYAEEAEEEFVVAPTV